jgi:long-chain-fatty-acid--[acyl-carrier-protein] ligase
LAITGAEKCPEATYRALKERSPQMTILEGYGITECSPIVSATPESDLVPGTIGRILPSMEYAILDPDSGELIAASDASSVDPTRPGMLIVRGPNVFPGYLGDAPSPFVEWGGKRWYRTGDLVSQDAAGNLTFRGRLKRFVKIGGEMVSLPAIEAVLEASQAGSPDGPALAVESVGDDPPEIILFTTEGGVNRAEANRRLRDAGLSPLHNLTRVEIVDSIPVLGTGKTDYRSLRILAEKRIR